MTDDSAFEALYEAHYEDLLRYALRRVSEPADAADMVAETWVVAWRRRQELPRDGERRLWLFGVARRVLANQRRGQLRQLRLADRLREELSTATTSEHVDNPALRALARLSPPDQELLTLRGWEQLEPHEIAVVLGVSAPTVRVRLHRARARLRAALAAEGHGRSAATGDAQTSAGDDPLSGRPDRGPRPAQQHAVPIRDLARETS